MSNYPAGAEHDPRAPWNDCDEQHYDDILSDIKGALADELPQVVWYEVCQHVSDADMQLELYDEIMEKASRIWESL